MAQLDLQAKLAILADAAKYDASCASSGTAKRDSKSGKGVGVMINDSGIDATHDDLKLGKLLKKNGWQAGKTWGYDVVDGSVSGLPELHIETYDVTTIRASTPM